MKRFSSANMCWFLIQCSIARLSRFSMLENTASPIKDSKRGPQNRSVQMWASISREVPSGNQTWPWKMDMKHGHVPIYKPPFIGDVPLPCLISTGYSMLGWKDSCSDDAKHVFWCRSPEAAEEIVKLKGENQAGARGCVDDDLGSLPMEKSTTSGFYLWI